MDEQNIRAVIIEDEEFSQKLLKNLLERYCPDIEIIGIAGSVKEAIDVLSENKPDLLFLDVRLGDGNGFDVLKHFDYSEVPVIFTTAYDEYALKAFRFSAVDYLLKPIDIDELREAVKKVTSMRYMEDMQLKLEHLMFNIGQQAMDNPVITLSTSTSFEFIPVSEVLRCEAQGAYSFVFTKGGHKVMVSKVIKEFEGLLKDFGFYRVHQSHLINLSEIRAYDKQNAAIVLKNGTALPVAKSRKEGLFDAISSLKYT